MCPTIQFCSDTVYLKLVSDPTSEGLSPTRLHPLQIPITSPRLSPVLLNGRPYIGGFQHLILKLDNLLRCLTELRKIVYLVEYQFIMLIKRQQPRNSQMEEMRKARYVGRGTELLSHHLPSASTWSGPRSSLKPIFLESLWRLHHVGMMDF